MLKLGIPAWNIALRTAAVYLVSLIGLRPAGGTTTHVKRPVKYLKHQ